VSRDWTISLIGAATCHLLALALLQGALHEPARLIPDTAVAVSLIAPPAEPAAAPALATPVVEPAPPVIPAQPAQVPPPTPPAVVEPFFPEQTSMEPEPKRVTIPPEVRPEPAPIAQVVKPNQPTGTSGAASNISFVRQPTGAVANQAAGAGASKPGKSAHPRYRHNPPPEYPALARQRRQEGVVLLAVRVTAKGKAGEVTVKKSSGFPLLDEAAMRTVRRWEFEPARSGGLPVESDTEVPVRFQLSN
jgi:protein TonB